MKDDNFGIGCFLIIISIAIISINRFFIEWILHFFNYYFINDLTANLVSIFSIVLIFLFLVFSKKIKQTLYFGLDLIFNQTKINFLEKELISEYEKLERINNIIDKKIITKNEIPK